MLAIKHISLNKDNFKDFCHKLIDLTNKIPEGQAIIINELLKLK